MNLTPTAMVNELNTRLHSPEGGSDRVLFWLNEEQDYIEKLRDDWYWMYSLNNTITTVDGTSTYDLPADFGRMLTMRDETNNQKLDPRSLSWLYEYDATPTEEGEPSYYILLGPTGTSNVWQVRFDLVSDTDDETIAYDYYKKLPPLTLSADTPSLVPDHAMLMLGAEIRGRIDNEEPEDLSILQGNKMLYEQRKKALLRRQDFDRDADKHIKKDYRLTGEGFYWGSESWH